MVKEKISKVKVINQDSPAAWVFFAAWIGALVYFVQRSDGFLDFFLAILKSIVWPAYVVHAVLVLLRIN